MQIVTSEIQIERPCEISTEFILQKLKEQKIMPLRWAIVEVLETTLKLDVAYYQN